ncbi:hypothetical protein DHL47_05760 [Streptococcus panodentis]|uniref:Transposase InsH N-terminal domain-containing protein n=1 Tax=Streptococcus panodentis TaxID=1581472 RepID=A0ABS5AW88_9STRE|nr:hypothetical protein [Streptococcus panodentis]
MGFAPCQTMKEIEMNIAFRWFLGIGFESKVPHFSTYGKNYERRFKDRAVVEAIFNHILSLCFHYHFEF